MRYVFDVPLLGSLRKQARHRLGSAVHNAGIATRADIRALAADVSTLRAELAAIGLTEEFHGQLASFPARAIGIDRTLADSAARLAAVERLQRIDSVSRWIKHASLDRHPLVSVIVPTKDRTNLLCRALESVLNQRYDGFEVVVIDDGGQEDSHVVIDKLGDPRIRWSRISSAGVCAARNSGLKLARGEIIAYLDDDNLMDPEWLYAVVWAFDQRPDADVLYGAIVIDDMRRMAGESSGELPLTFLPSWNREAVLEQDMGAIAHRGGLPEARFNESLSYHGDGDLLYRLTADRDPLVLPVVACYYTTDAPDRISVSGWTTADREHLAT